MPPAIIPHWNENNIRQDNLQLLLCVFLFTNFFVMQKKTSQSSQMLTVSKKKTTKQPYKKKCFKTGKFLIKIKKLSDQRMSCEDTQCSEALTQKIYQPQKSLIHTLTHTNRHTHIQQRQRGKQENRKDGWGGGVDVHAHARSRGTGSQIWLLPGADAGRPRLTRLVYLLPSATGRNHI